METAPQIMVEHPYAVEDTPATCPRAFSHPTIQLNGARYFRGTEMIVREARAWCKAGHTQEAASNIKAAGSWYGRANLRNTAA